MKAASLSADLVSVEVRAVCLSAHKINVGPAALHWYTCVHYSRYACVRLGTRFMAQYRSAGTAFRSLESAQLKLYVTCGILNREHWLSVLRRKRGLIVKLHGVGAIDLDISRDATPARRASIYFIETAPRLEIQNVNPFGHYLYNIARTHTLHRSSLHCNRRYDWISI